MLMRNEKFKQDTRTIRRVEETRDMENYKPYRTAAQKASARRMAQKQDGRFVSFAPVSHHAHRG